MYNREKAEAVYQDIVKGMFSYNQKVWASQIVREGMTFDEVNECGTSHCFAGRVVALSERQPLYLLDGHPDLGRYSKAEFVTALESDPEADVRQACTEFTGELWTSAHLTHSESCHLSTYAHGLYVLEYDEDKTARFVPYFGKIISYAQASNVDLGLPEDHGMYAARNSLGDIKSYLDNFARGNFEPELSDFDT